MNDTLVLIPTYNNAGTLEDVVRRALAQGLPVMVVNDGCTDGTARILDDILESLQLSGAFARTGSRSDAEESCKLSIVSHPENRGKGKALKTGFQEAKRLGYKYVITLDADGQHFPEDIPVLLAEKGDNTLVVGSRSVRGIDGHSSFANRFSNFWFRLYTTVNLPDTQTGYRLYPLERLPWLGLLSARYEAELTLLVFSAWKGLELKPVPVRVSYPEDRVSHFRPFRDFARISLLNTLLLFIAIVYGYPRTLLRKIHL